MKKLFCLKNSLIILAVFVFVFGLAFLGGVGGVEAATRTWEGDDLTNPTYWNDADNWGGTVPEVGDDVVMNNAANCNVNEATAALKDEEVLAQWQNFVDSETEQEAQAEVKNLLEMLVNKIKI
ncbi:MAG: hypothetical protein Q8N69_01160 [bacterium]|nr:hypothetical protein [bacterium]